MAVDTKGQRLLFPESTSGTIEVIDLRSAKTSTPLSASAGSTQTIYLPQTNKSGRRRRCTVKAFSGETYELVKNIRSLATI